MSPRHVLVRRRAAPAWLATLACLLAWAGHARAQSDEERLASRAILLRQAQEAQAAGQHTTAVDLARRAGRIQWTPSLRRFLAEELAATGDLSGAFGAYQTCIREANGGSTRDRPHAAACREGARALEARVGLILVQVPAPLPDGLVVTIGERVLASELLGVPVPFTPGRYVVRALANGGRMWTQTVDLTARHSFELHVQWAAGPAVPPTTPAPRPEPPSTSGPAPDVAGVTAQLTHPPTPSPPPSRAPNAALIAGITVAGVVVAGAVAGGVAYWALDRAAGQQSPLSLTPGYQSGGLVSEPSP